MEKLIELDHVTAGYDRKIVLRDICLGVWEKDFLGIIGPNGGGKTTLLKIILGLLTPISGEIKRFEDKTSGSAPKIGYLPQMSNIDRRFPISVREVIASGLAAEKPAFKAFSESQNRRVDEVIAQMGLEEFAGRAIGQLSGGQLQRVLLGRSVVSKPQILNYPGLARHWHRAQHGQEHRLRQRDPPLPSRNGCFPRMAGREIRLPDRVDRPRQPAAPGIEESPTYTLKT